MKQISGTDLIDKQMLRPSAARNTASVRALEITRLDLVKMFSCQRLIQDTFRLGADRSRSRSDIDSQLIL
jgi:hypothetical protein